MAITFVIVIPVMGVLYMDMQTATNKAAHEVRKMRELRKEILLERVKE